MPTRVITGGQSGVDRGVLDACLEAQFPCGGFCPQGRLAEDGSIPDRYPLLELSTRDYALRTEANVEAAGAVLILTRYLPLTTGSRLTEKIAVRQRKPVATIALTGSWTVVDVVDWMGRHAHGVLMVAGPRESKDPGIAEESRLFFLKILEAMRRGRNTKA